MDGTSNIQRLHITGDVAARTTPSNASRKVRT
jgi:hypothetical protein